MEQIEKIEMCSGCGSSKPEFHYIETALGFFVKNYFLCRKCALEEMQEE